MTKFSDIAQRYLLEKGYEPYLCETEDEARSKCLELIQLKKWPCYFFKSDTTGEKDFEEFFTDKETLNMNIFKNIGVIKNKLLFDDNALCYFEENVKKLFNQGSWTKNEILNLFQTILPDFKHLETGKYLDQKM